MKEITPDWQAWLDCILRKGTPERVHFIELFLDGEVQNDVCQRFGLLGATNEDDPFFAQKRLLVTQRFLGYDYVRCGLDPIPVARPPGHKTKDTAGMPHENGRVYVEQHKGLITTWDEFEAYPWPDVDQVGATAMEWFHEHLPAGMCVIGGGGFGHFCEYLSLLMGYETLCYALFDQRDLVAAVSDRLTDIFEESARRILAFDRVKALWGSDDMGFRTGTLISPDDLREFVLPGHKRMARLAHDAGHPYLLHSCGNLTDIMDDLIDDVKIDAKHSFEDAIEDVVTAKHRYGRKIALLGGIDVDFLCRADEGQIRTRVRETLEVCMPGGGYCLGTGNSVANYIPVDNYLTMLDEGRRFQP